MRIEKLGILGGGAWGTALAKLAAETGQPTLLWARNPDVVASIRRGDSNPLYLPGVALPGNLKATGNLEDLRDCDALILAVPAQTVRHYATEIRRLMPLGTPVVLAAKGIEIETGLLPGEAIAELLPGSPFAVLTGPNFAGEVARGLPAAAVLASNDAAYAAALAERIAGPAFRPYVSDDPIGAQVGGAVKNVLAIACGIVIGRKLGDNARAALITRGLAEMVRLGLAKGGKAETLMGLSGLGDLVLTCSGPQSRNLSLGIALGEGKTLAEILQSRRSVAEGVPTAEAVVKLAAALNIEMPISTAVHAILHQNADIDRTIAGLLARPLKAE